MTQRTLRASSEDRSAALLRASLERRNAKLADTVGRQAKVIERLRGELGRANDSMEAAKNDILSGRHKAAWDTLDERMAENDDALAETKP